MRNQTQSDEWSVPISYGSTESIDTGSWSSFKPQSFAWTPPCREACPVSVDIPLFMHFVEKGRYEDALWTVLRENPFPGVCGRVCFHPCETGCNRKQYDEAVSIQQLERFVAGVETKEAGIRPAATSNPRKVAVIGSGPSGLSCAYFLALLGHCPTVFEAKNEPGGVMRWGIPQFRLPRNVLKKEIRRILLLPIELKTGCRVGKQIPYEDLGRFDAIFLSPGAGLNALLSIEGENLDGVCSGGEFLERIKAGETIASADQTLVIGGGNTALDAARSALRLGSRVTIAYRRTRNEMSAIEDEVSEALEEGIDFRFLVQPVKIRRSPGGKLQVFFQRMELGLPDGGNRRSPVPMNGEFLTLEADRVIHAVGEWVDLSWMPDALVKNGLIETGSIPGIYAGGDAVDQPRTIATAISAGKRSAISMDLDFRGIHDRDILEKFRMGNKGSISMEAYLQSREKGIESRENEDVSPGQINTLYFEKSRRSKTRKLGLETRRRTFLEVNLGIGAKKASLLASRCYSCGTCNACRHCVYFCPEGVISVDPDARTWTVDTRHCKGCGICARSCPRHAVFMKDLS